MIIAEALNERKDCYTKAKALANQIAADAVVEKKNPERTAVDVKDLQLQFHAALEKATELTVKINLANNREKVVFEGNSLSLMAAIALRDAMTLDHTLRKSILDAIDLSLGKGAGRRFYGRARSKDDIKEVSLIDQDALRKEIDALAEKRRQLDIEIQKVNWSAEL